MYLLGFPHHAEKYYTRTSRRPTTGPIKPIEPKHKHTGLAIEEIGVWID